jgi:phage shock protein PspC (stress-responsive transcriptional regulator)
MKKNISINISGIIFHIEEDGYETLKKYLDSINKYFSTFEDSSEILADIESRIAEIFLSKLNEEKQVITVEDVNALVSTMGSVSDFRAVEEVDSVNENASSYQTPPSGDTSGTSAGSPTYAPSKQLMRDQKRKILGGVCSGMANYFNVDALWIRLIFALLTFAYGLTFIIYIIMWILVPGSYDLDEPVVGKKMYRNPEKKVIGGVAAGVAAYLGIDIVASRILFILLALPGGFGILVYIVLWVILPEARTLTDRMQMQGEPVTLSNIESTLKKNQFEKNEQESTLTRIILFPFRLIGMLLTALARILGPMVEVVRVLIGVFIVLIGVSLLFSIVVSAGMLFGLFSANALSVPWMNEFNEASLPVDAFLRAFPTWTAVAAFFATAIPTVFIILLGISVIAKKIIFNAAAGWSLFVIFFISVGMLAVGVPRIVYAFKEDADFEIENVYRVNGKTAVLKINEAGMDDYRAVRLDIQGHSERTFKLVQVFEAQGSSRAKAVENAKMVEYNVNVRDSVFTFDSNLKFKDDAVFRAQRLNMTLYIPYNFPFIMDEETSRFINQYIDHRYIDGETWIFTEEDGLNCVSCPKDDTEKYRELVDFDEIEITGKFDVRIIPGNEYSVDVSDPATSKDKYEIRRSGETLIIDYMGRKDIDWNLNKLNVQEVEIVITLPDLERLEAVGVGTIRIDEFHADDLMLDVRGPVVLKGEFQVDQLYVNLSGSSEAEISGHTNHLNANIELASKLKAYNLQAEEAFVETSGASSAKVNVNSSIEVHEGIASKIEIRGNAQVIKRN